MASSAKKSRGRQKVEMVRMEKDSNRQVTFSKRRTGLFKKASELCTLCGAEAAIIVFSPGKKAFSFGHPSVEMIINRFLISYSSPASDSTSADQHLLEAHRDTSLYELNAELTLLNNRIEIEKKRGEELNDIKEARKEQCWWDAPNEELVLEHLTQLKSSLEELKKNVIEHGNKLMMEVPSTAPFMGIDPLVPFDGALFNLNAANGYTQGYYQP